MNTTQWENGYLEGYLVGWGEVYVWQTKFKLEHNGLNLGEQRQVDHLGHVF